MKTYTINQLLSINTWTICCSPGAIIHKSFFTQEIISLRRDDTDGKYIIDKVFNSLSQDGIKALEAMLRRHNNTESYQREAENFDMTLSTK